MKNSHKETRYSKHAIFADNNVMKKEKEIFVFVVLMLFLTMKQKKLVLDVLNTKISLVRTTLPIKAELMPIFPTLLANGAEGMPNIEIVVDNEKGTVLKSDKALRVSKIKVCEL